MPEKRSASSQWLADVMLQLKAQPGEEIKQEMSKTFAVQVCRQASAQWATLTTHEKAQVYVRTQCGVMAKKQELAAVLEALETQHETLIEKLEEEKSQ
eukprot:4598541-Lingulodinium_polyedra.AAC.1